MDVFLDIETVPCSRPDLRDRLAAKIEPPALTKSGKYRTEEDLIKWAEEERPKLIDDAVAKCGLNGATCEVVCIAMAVASEPVSASVGKETYVLSWLADVLVDLQSSSRNKSRLPRFVGHNIISFDLRVLAQRAIVCGVHELLPLLPIDAKPWSDNVYDTMIQWAGVGNRISLDDLCWALGLEGKTGMTGADIWPMYQQGRLAEIRQYCAEDVERVRNVHRRMTGAK